jgi:hypothetical protein
VIRMPTTSSHYSVREQIRTRTGIPIPEMRLVYAGKGIHNNQITHVKTPQHNTQYRMYIDKCYVLSHLFCFCRSTSDILLVVVRVPIPIPVLVLVLVLVVVMLLCYAVLYFM